MALASQLLRRIAMATAVVVTLSSVPTADASAQSTHAVEGAGSGIAVGSELDAYLRYLESLGETPLVPWGLRGFAPAVVDSLTAVHGTHPWANDWIFARAERSSAVRVLPLELTERFNSSYPFGINEGPVWAGRGLTSAVSGGVAISAGPLSISLRPLAFRAENASFALRPNGWPGPMAFADPRSPDRVDRPQRFGSSAYSRFEPGESTIRLDLLGVSVGATTANEWWGPATVFPFIVGNNAAGVPRVFVGTEHPTNIFIGMLQARVEYGMEFQSAFSPVVGPDTFVSPDSSGRRRLMSGLAVTFSPAFAPGFELDAGRYFHEAWSGHFSGSDLATPFEGLLKGSISAGPSIAGIDNRDVLKNQLASVGFRWVLPHGGFDVYGEYGREDFAEDVRALEVQPDLSRVFMLGFRKAFRHADSTSIDGLRAEVFDGDPTAMGLYRTEGRTYVHYPIRQGHTEEGKVIGSPAGIGAPSAATVAWDAYRASGRASVYLTRMSENTSSELPSAPWRTALAGVSALRFTRFGDASVDIAAVRTSRVPAGWGGWNLSATAGMRLRMP